jgi:hypothetical protein
MKVFSCQMCDKILSLSLFTVISDGSFVEVSLVGLGNSVTSDEFVTYCSMNE